MSPPLCEKVATTKKNSSIKASNTFTIFAASPPTEELRQKIIYVDPELKVCRAWSLGEVEYFEKHKERNWYVVRRQLRTTARSSPYVAIDSINVYMAPTKEAPFVLENFSNMEGVPSRASGMSCSSGMSGMSCVSCEKWVKIGKTH